MDLSNQSTVNMSGQEVADLVRERIRAAGLWQIPGEKPVEGRTHLVSPEPFRLSPQQVDTLNKLGEALRRFYIAVNDLYLRSEYEWVREYLDIGKGDDILRHARMKYQKQAVPRVIRPDILLMEDGFAITELDSVPGGMGHLDCLSAAYEEAGFDLVGLPRGMRDGFGSILRDVAGMDDPVCAIVVSDESVDYLPEMQYLAGELREVGLRAYTVHPREVIFTEDGLYIEADSSRLKVDMVYRFYELFDLLNIPKAELLAYSFKKKTAAVTPPYKPFLEEKMLLAFLYHDALGEFWMKALGEEHFEFLKNVISPTWVMDNRPVPPHGEISGFRWRGGPVRDWTVISEGTQKERQLVLKPSGFSPLAWGSRGVKIGHDMSQEEWAEVVRQALDSFDNSPYVLQPYRDTAVIGVKYYDEPGREIRDMQARVRLCPYYFVNDDRAEMGGVLATACPRDKKLIHGMVDSVIAPCQLK